MRPGLVSAVALISWLSTAQVRAADELIPGEIAVVKAGRLARFVSRSKPQRGDAPFALPAPGSSGDPTIHGAILTFADVGLRAGTAEYLLDASGWRGLGDPAGSRGYVYAAKDDTSDPDPDGSCRTALLKDTVIKASCKGGVPLSTPFADAGSIVLGMGAGGTSIRYCAEFGGEEERNDSVRMKRKGAPRPFACPLAECPPFVIPPQRIAGACWYPAPDTSCSMVCGFLGLRYSEATRTFAGSDGSAANCSAVLSAFGGGSIEAVDVDCEEVGLQGLGCFVSTEFILNARCSSPPTTADASAIGAFRACACR